MIETAAINSDGTYRLNDGRATRYSEGTVIIINPDGGHSYTAGIILEDNITFKAYSNGSFSEDIHVRHGKGALLAVQVTGVSGGDNLQFGYTG